MRFYRKLRRKPWRYLNVIVLIIALELLFPQFAHATVEVESMSFDTRSPVITVDKLEYEQRLSYIEELQELEKPDTSGPRENPFPETPDRSTTKSIRVTATAYSSTPDQTSGNPFITASGAHVVDGGIAYNHLPFGSKVRFPEVHGDKVFTVLDRLPSHNGGPYHIDIWMPSREQAVQWGVRVILMEVLE